MAKTHSLFVSFDLMYLSDLSKCLIIEFTYLFGSTKWWFFSFLRRYLFHFWQNEIGVQPFWISEIWNISSYTGNFRCDGFIRGLLRKTHFSFICRWAIASHVIGSPYPSENQGWFQINHPRFLFYVAEWVSVFYKSIILSASLIPLR